MENIYYSKIKILSNIYDQTTFILITTQKNLSYSCEKLFWQSFYSKTSET